jgi:hypothetical protein
MLSLAVPRDCGRVLFAILPPVIRIPGSPFLRTIAAHLAVYRVGSHLLPVIVGAPEALTLGFAAHRLRRPIFRWLKDPLTVAASPFDHTGGCRILRRQIVKADLETAVECVLHPGRWLFSSASKPPETLTFYAAINSRAGSTERQHVSAFFSTSS